MCGFGIHLDGRPHNFDLLWKRNPKEWEFWMQRCCKDPDGTEFGWARVLDWIGVEWREPWNQFEDTADQMSLFCEEGLENA